VPGPHVPGSSQPGRICGPFLCQTARGITPTIRRERRRHNAIEPVIDHLKSDGHVGRNFLLGTEGNATNLIFAAAGHNLRLLRAWIA
jgi:transposase, IS5 family